MRDQALNGISRCPECEMDLPSVINQGNPITAWWTLTGMKPYDTSTRWGRLRSSARWVITIFILILIMTAGSCLRACLLR
ncbi:MAG: hypothetical protein ACYTBZ_05835 [Planctomycetota bacterium]